VSLDSVVWFCLLRLVLALLVIVRFVVLFCVVVCRTYIPIHGFSNFKKLRENERIASRNFWSSMRWLRSCLSGAKTLC